MTSSPIEQNAGLPLTPAVTRELLLRTADLPGADWRVLAYYVTAAPLGQTVRETAKVVAEALQLSPGSISKSISRLIDGGWLTIAFRVGRVPFYRAGDQVMRLAVSNEEQDEAPLASVRHLPIRVAAEGE
ncbi:MarR family transcriptional regulator [Streptomyces chrestomyceticus]|uniref:MarR family transcriptional regulator n=1 Tax=Streptomyces chrestomyceticus TaxID=68185 RepID=UPI0033DD36DC